MVFFTPTALDRAVLASVVQIIFFSSLAFFVWSWAKQYQNDCSAALRLSLFSRWNNVFGKDAIMMCCSFDRECSILYLYKPNIHY